MAKRATRVTKDVPGQELLAFIDEIEHRLEIVDAECQVQQWENYLKKGNAPALLSCESERASLLLDEDLWLTVMKWVGTLSPAHPAWRRLVLLGRRLIPATVESQADVYELNHQIQEEFLSYTPQIGGDKLPWGKFVNALYTHPDRQYRERVWQALVPIADKLRERFLQLVRHRNQWARQHGYDNYIDLVLAPQGLSRDSVLERYVDLEEVTLDSYKSVLSRIRSRLPFKDPGVWDLTYFPQSRLSALEGHTFSGSSPDVVALIKALGIPWDSFHFAPQLTHRLPYSCLFWPNEIPNNIELAVSHQQGWTAYVEMARGFGQAVLAGLTQQPSYLLRQSAPCYSAGMGAFLARLAADPTWLRRRQLLSDTRRFRLEQLSHDMLILRLRQLMALSVFEYQIYETSGVDLDTIWGEVQEAFLLLPDSPWSGWIAQADYIFRPIHLQNEVIGEIIASQAVSYLQQRFGPLFDNLELAEFLKESVYGDGSAQDWVDQVRTATGKFLSNKALFSELVGEE